MVLGALFLIDSAAHGMGVSLGAVWAWRFPVRLLSLFNASRSALTHLEQSTGKKNDWRSREVTEAVEPPKWEWYSFMASSGGDCAWREEIPKGARVRVRKLPG